MKYDPLLVVESEYKSIFKVFIVVKTSLCFIKNQDNFGKKCSKYMGGIYFLTKFYLCQNYREIIQIRVT